MKQKLKRLEHADAQINLFGVSFGQIRAEQDLSSQLEEMTDLKAFFEKTLACADDDSFMLGIVINIERYLGRSLPFYLSLDYDFPELEGCPKVEDYEFGYYGHDMQPGTLRFIRDRATWALKIINKKILVLEKFLVQCREVKWTWRKLNENES